MPLLIGADPEFFLRDEKERKYVSAHDIIPGSKVKPFELPNDLGFVHPDGTAVEFAIKPAENAEVFSRRIQGVLDYLRVYIDSRYSFYIKPKVTYNRAYYNNLPSSVKRLGCSADYANGKIRGPFQIPSPYCFSGGHVHVGWTENKDVEDPDRS